MQAGKPLVWYMGDDARNEYIYKYVSNKNWDPQDATGGLAAGDKYIDDGRLYVARFKADGTGEWLELCSVASTVNALLAAGRLEEGTARRCSLSPRQRDVMPVRCKARQVALA